MLNNNLPSSWRWVRLGDVRTTYLKEKQNQNGIGSSIHDAKLSQMSQKSQKGYKKEQEIIRDKEISKRANWASIGQKGNPR
jgi:hypothetical protein